MKRFLFNVAVLLLITGAAYLWIGRFLCGDAAIDAQRYKLERIKLGENFDAIILGDSRAMAIDWDEKSLDLYNYSLAYLGGFYPLQFFLSQYLFYNRPPKVIVLCVTPKTFMAAHRFDLQQRSAHLFPFLEVLREARAQNQLVMIPALLRMRYDVSNFIILNLSTKQAIRRLNQRTGSMIFSETERYRDTTEMRSLGSFSPSPQGARYFNSFISATRQKHIRVILYFMPIPASAAQRNRKYYQEFRKYLKGISHSYPDIFIVKPYTFDELWPDELFCDADHLNRAGAQRFHRDHFPKLLELVRSRSEAY